MGLQSLCCSFSLPKFQLSDRRLPFSSQINLPATVRCPRTSTINPNNAAKSILRFSSKGIIEESASPKRIRTARLLCASSSHSGDNEVGDVNKDTDVQRRNLGGVEPFRGKSGSISFHGLTHHLVEESKLVSAPFNEGTGSLLWVLAPVVLILSLVLPPLFISSAVDAAIQDAIIAEIVVSLSSEAVFYVGLATFLLITDQVQKPYRQFTAKRWGLITGLKGYLTSAFFIMGLKVVAPVFAAYITWPMLGLPAVAAVIPFLVGCLVQFIFELGLDKKGSSCWPLVPIIFEVYRLYQLSKASHFIERMMFAMRDLPRSPELMEKGGAMVAMVVTFKVLGVACLWSLMTFLLRLFPSRPVSENY